MPAKLHGSMEQGIISTVGRVGRLIAGSLLFLLAAQLLSRAQKSRPQRACRERGSHQHCSWVNWSTAGTHLSCGPVPWTASAYGSASQAWRMSRKSSTVNGRYDLCDCSEAMRWPLRCKEGAKVVKTLTNSSGDQTSVAGLSTHCQNVNSRTHQKSCCRRPVKGLLSCVTSPL
jgi:hypothetical protein